MASGKVRMRPNIRRAYEQLSRTRLVVPTMSLSPPSDKHIFPPTALEDARKPEAAAHWESLQPPPNSALIALAHRMGIAGVFTSPSAKSNGKAKAWSTVEDEQMALLIRQACTHDSFARRHAAVYPDESTPPTNGMLASLGNTLLGLFATEHLNASYPHLPTRVLKAAASAYVGHQTCVNVAQELGVAPLVRWHRQQSSASKQAVTHADALASVPRALTALIYHYRSLAVARKFAHTFFLSRLVDLRGFIKFRDPKLALSYTVQNFGRERPISRLLRETGRGTNAPIYVVGIFSGVDKLGEGFGSSLKMAEFRAAEDALHRLYLTRVPSDLLALPTTAFPTPPPKQRLSVFDAITNGSVAPSPYEPFSFPSFDPDSSEQTTTVGQSEILFGINDKKDVNVVEDLKRPWWRPAEDYPINSPQAERVREIKARREADRKRIAEERESEGHWDAKLGEETRRQGRMRTAEDMQAEEERPRQTV